MDPQRMLQYLPALYHDAADDDGVLAMLLAAMARLQSPVERLLDRIDGHFDPRTAPAHMVPYLAGWFGLERYLDWAGGRPGQGTPRYAAGLPQLRELVARAAGLARWRGTRRGLEDFLEAATGVPGFRIGEDAGRRFHLVIDAPAAAQVLAGLVERVVEDERPAYATFEIRFAAPPSPPGSTQES